MVTKLPSFAIPLLLLPVLAAAEQFGGGNLACALVRGSANLQVDGSLSEWDSRIIAQPLRWSNSVYGPPPDTSKANVRCLADDRFLYLGVAVVAPSLDFESVPFNQAWRNDAVEVFLSSRVRDSAPHVRTGMIRVSADSSGWTISEGSVSVTDGVHTTRKFSYPSLWGVLQVRAALQFVSTGYTVEIAFPRDTLGLTQTESASELSVNVRVRRRCDNRPCEAVIQLVDDPYNSSPVSDERYWPVSFAWRQDGGAVAQDSAAESLRSVIYSALLRLDALDAEGAVSLLRTSPDRRLLPVTGSALMAAGHPDAAIPLLSSVSEGGIEESVRLWATEQMALCHSLLGSSTTAHGEYGTLITTGNPAFQDIGVAGVIDLALARGNWDAAISAYEGVFGGATAPGLRSAARISDWLQKTGRVSEAIGVLTRVSESAWAQDSERAWALLQIQAIQARRGDVEKALATAWRLQETSPPGDCSGTAGLKMLIPTVNAAPLSVSATYPFSEIYQHFLERNPHATDPTRQIAYAAELQREHKPEAAVTLYEKIAGDDGALRSERAAAMLALQRLRLESGQLVQSVQTGMTIHEMFPQDLAARMASWRLMRLAFAADKTPNAVVEQAEKVGRILAENLRSSAQAQTDHEKRSALALLRQFTKEASQQ